jgi:PH domain
VVISKVVTIVKKHAAGAYVLHSNDTNQFYGLLLYADDEGLRSSDSIASKNKMLGDKMSNMCATPLFREVLEATPIAVRTGAKLAHLTRVEVRENSEKNAIEAAIKEYHARVVPRLLDLKGWTGLLVAAQYNDNRIFLFNFFDSAPALQEFKRAGALNEVASVLRDFMAAPVSFEVFDVVLQVGAGSARVSAAEAVVGCVHCGFMHKEGGFIRNFKRRFFILRDHMLYYYESDAADKPIGAVALTGATVEADQSNTKLFRILTPRRRWVFMCDSAEDARAWLNAVLTALPPSED